jgi:hypothetical protein
MRKEGSTQIPQFTTTNSAVTHLPVPPTEHDDSKTDEEPLPGKDKDTGYSGR